MIPLTWRKKEKKEQFSFIVNLVYILLCINSEEYVRKYMQESKH